MAHATHTKKILGFVAVWIVLINAFALLAWNRTNATVDTAYEWIDPHHLHSASWEPLALPARWDSEWYLDIARHGYVFKPADQLQNTVFYPLYPALIRLFGMVFGNLVLTGWLISLGALIGGCIVLAKLVREFHPKLAPDDVVFFALIFPTAIFFNAVYTESLFLLLSVTSIYFARKRLFVAASVVGAAAALTRITGALLFLPLAIEFLTVYKGRKALRWEGLALFLVPLAAASFFLFHFLHTGDPLFFFHVESTWGRSFAFNPAHFATATSPALVNLLLDVSILIAGIGLAVVAYKKLRPSYAVYALATILVAVSSGSLMSIGRYLLVLFPLSMAVAALPKEFKRAWTIGSLLLLALYTMLFAHSYWTG